jgi:hypothetical protein
MSVVTEQKLKKALVAGLSAWTGLPAAKIVPAFTREIPTKPYIQYKFFTAWQYPGRNVEHNPPTRAFHTLVPQDPPIVTGIAFGGGRILVDYTQDLRAAGVQPAQAVQIGSQTSFIMRVRTPHTLELRDPIVIPGSSYAIRRQVVRVEYWKSALKGLAVQCVTATPAEADELIDKIINFFKLPSGFRDAALREGVPWYVRSVGDAVNVDEVSNNQIVARVRDVTVTLIGQEIISEERPPMELLDWDVHAPEGGIKPVVAPPEWPVVEPILPIRIRE